MIAEIIISVIAAAALGYALYCKIRTEKLLCGINSMLDSAIDGSFTESSFTESVMSSLESKLWKYLSSSEISARKTAEEKEKIKTLISDISHQTKTPLSNIRLYSELLSELPLSDEAAEYAGNIGAQSEKLGFLITSLVKLSRLETGIITLSPKQGDIFAMLDGLTAEYSAAASAKGLSFTVENADITAVFDEKWTAEAIGNIIDNAVKYTVKGGITVSARDYEMFARIDISDTGIGIPEEEQAKIFSRFYRSESVSSQSGAGIGLFLAREIISGEGGYIKVSSESGKGAVFSVFLPKAGKPRGNSAT